jgi:hypothetical protein
MHVQKKIKKSDFNSCFFEFFFERLYNSFIFDARKIKHIDSKRSFNHLSIHIKTNLKKNFFYFKIYKIYISVPN